jgi:hypothetical protein
MSFEGFYQRICASGHYFGSDAISEMYGEGGIETCDCGNGSKTGLDFCVVVC